jgi:hypothetical protein
MRDSRQLVEKQPPCPYIESVGETKGRGCRYAQTQRCLIRACTRISSLPNVSTRPVLATCLIHACSALYTYRSGLYVNKSAEVVKRSRMVFARYGKVGIGKLLVTIIVSDTFMMPQKVPFFYLSLMRMGQR